jgi:hypothetical protein
MLRGVRLRRSKDGWWVGFLHHRNNSEIEVFGLAPIRLDESEKRWVFQNHDGTSGAVPVDKDPMMAKALFIALMILRHLSPALKADVLPALEITTDSERKLCVGVARDTARLYRVPSPVRDWYVLRDIVQPEEPFAGLSAYEGTFELRTNSQYRDLDVQRIHAAVNTATSTMPSEWLRGQKGDSVGSPPLIEVPLSNMR